RSLATDTSGNGSWWTWSWTWDTTRWTNGWHHIVAVAYDNSSLAADTSIVVLVENPLDEAPHVVITAPDDGATVSGIVNSTGHAGDHDLGDRGEKVELRIDVGDWQLATDVTDLGNWATWTLLWDATHAERGWHHVYARSFDGEAYSKIAVLELFVSCEGEGN